MADKPKADPAKPAEPPKPVHIGGESLVDRILPHIKKIVWTTLAIAVVVGGVFGYRACKHNKQAKETGKVATVLEAGMKPVADPKEAPDPVKNPGFTNEKERADKMLGEATAQGASLPPELNAALLADAGKLDEAIAEYKKCEAGTTMEAVLCREGLGIALEAKALAQKDPAARDAGLKEALAVFARMQPVEDGPRKPYAVYHEGRLNLALGKRAEGKALLEKAKAMKPPSDLAQLIERRLASLGAA